MLITNKVKIHMDTPHQRLIPVDVMQCDTETRALELELYVASKPWVIPTDVELVAAYFKTNGVKGLYDTLHDGSPACSTAGNVITAILPPEALSTPGQIMFSILMRAGERTQLSTFSVPVRIHPNPAIGAVESGDYFNLQRWVDAEVLRTVNGLRLPNPHKLTFTGAVEAVYDGSEAVTVSIPSGTDKDVLLLADRQTGRVYRLFAENGQLKMTAGDGIGGMDCVTLTDRQTGRVYELYVHDGELKMTE